jgi:hypothetical protein
LDVNGAVTDIMSAITDFEVTYGGALATNKFHRIVDAAGAGVDMNAGELMSS